MNHESLQKLFGEIRDSNPETSIDEVSVWLDTASIVKAGASSTAVSLTLKMILMTSILAIAITAGIFFMTYDKHVEQPVTATVNENQSISVLPQPPLPTEPVKKVNGIIAAALPDLIQDSMQVQAELPEEKTGVKADDTTIFQASVKTEIPVVTIMSELQTDEPASGLWKSKNDSLNIDTVFNGVKKLVFRGVINNKVMVTGSRRNTVGMKYTYMYKAKGIFVGKNRCEVSFKKIDSVLTIEVERNATVKVGVSVTEKKSSITFDVPENIALDIRADYGDMEINDLRDNDFSFRTSYGDIKAQNLKGNIVLNSGYGDIQIDHINGKITCNTNYGDINGVYITGSESVELKSNYGDIKCQLTNPVTDCRLELKTGYGKIRVKRNDLEVESDKKLTFGNGTLKVQATSSYGNIVIK